MQGRKTGGRKKGTPNKLKIPLAAAKAEAAKETAEQRLQEAPAQGKPWTDPFDTALRLFERLQLAALRSGASPR